MFELLQPLTALSEVGIGTASVAAAVLTRVSALAFFLPGLGESSIPVRVRLTIVIAITLMLTPIAMIELTPPESISAMVFILAGEAISGAIIGFSIRIAIFIVQIAGAMISQNLSLAQLFGSGLSGQPEPPVASLLMVAAIALAVSAGLHFEVLKVLIFSFEVMPIGVFPGTSDTGQWAIERVAFAFSAAFSLALPFVVLGFVYNLAIGAANRAMPQLMVAFVGIPAVTLAGLALLAISAPVLLGVWISILDGIINNLSGVPS